MADLGQAALFAEREKEVFGQPPIEEGAESAGGEDGEGTKLTGENLGRFLSRDGAVFGIVVDEDGGLVAGVGQAFVAG